MILETDQDDHTVPRGFLSKLEEAKQRQEGLKEAMDVDEEGSGVRSLLRLFCILLTGTPRAPPPTLTRTQIPPSIRFRQRTPL